jgi:Holliday junction resolvasome RuvABC ATP-dependent DNA helicase subunit
MNTHWNIKLHLKVFFMKKLVECLPKVTDVTELFKYVRKGDTVVIDSCFRISRTLRDLLYIIDFLEDKKVTLISLKENF